MTPCRGLLLCLALLATGLAPALQAQYPQCGYGGGMQVHTYHIYVQRQQMMQQQMYMQQQMQAMRMQQQAQQLHMAQLQMHQQAQHLTQQSRFMMQQSRKFSMTPVHLAMQSRQLNMHSRTLHTLPTGLGMTPRALHTTSRALHQESRQLYTVPRHLEMTSRALHQESRQLHTTSRALHMEARQLHTEPRQLHMQAKQLFTQARSLSTKSQYCTSVETITVVTFNINCGQCHQQQKQLPSPLMVQGPQPRMPNLLSGPRPAMPNFMGMPRPGMPNLIAMPRPGMPNIMGMPRPGIPNLLPEPRLPGRMPEMWARPNLPQLPNVIPGPRPGMPNMLPPPPGPLVLNDPLAVMPMRPGLGELWSSPSKPGPRIVTRLDPSDYGIPSRRQEPAAKPKLVEPMRNPDLPGAKKPALAEGITVAETSRPLPTTVLEAPALPDRATDDGTRRGLTGEYETTPGGTATEPVEAVTPFRLLLSDADLQAPELPALPLSVLLFPAENEQPDAADDPDGAFPEFAPRDPLPIARNGSAGPARPDAPLNAPSLPSLPASVLGPG